MAQGIYWVWEVHPADADLILNLTDRFSWRYQLREFQSHFHVVAVDLRGYSPSDAPKDVDCYTIDLLLADIKDIILGLGMSQCPIYSSPHFCSFWYPLLHAYLIPTTSYTIVFVAFHHQGTPSVSS